MSSPLPLSMIWHGSNGSDGLEAGIHLRWQFDPRLGFPLEGFYLYRRSSCSLNLCTDFSDFPRRRIELPYEHTLRSGGKTFKIKISLPPRASDERGIILISKQGPHTRREILSADLIEFHLPDGTYEGQINIEIVNQGFFVIVPRATDGTEIDVQVFDRVGEQAIRFTGHGMSSILMAGLNTEVSKICFSVCEDCEKPWEGPINAKCGFGLPIKIPMIKLQQEREVKEEHEEEIARTRGGGGITSTNEENEVRQKMLRSLRSIEGSSPRFIWHNLEDTLAASKDNAAESRTCIKFGEQTAGSTTTLPNPYVSGQASFEIKDQSQIKVINIVGNTGIRFERERELAVSILPPSPEQIETKIVYLIGPITVEAYSEDGTLVDSKGTGNLRRGEVNEIVLRKDGSKISKVIFKTARGEAILSEFCYYKEQQQPAVTPTSCDPEWEVASCRLPKDKWCQFEGQPFQDLKEILALMVEGAKDAPMGWRTINYKNESTKTVTSGASSLGSQQVLATAAQKEVVEGGEMRVGAQETSGPEFQISPMDLVIMASVNPYIARILGLYWVDTAAKEGEVYDYKIVANWPEGTLWNLENVVDFDKETIGKKFFSIFRHEDFVFFNEGVSTVDFVPSAFARAKRGLHISFWKKSITASPPYIRINCTKPVKELQLFVKHQGQSVTLEAFRNNALVGSSTLLKSEGVLAVHYPENIDYVKLISKEDVIIYKICWDVEYISHGQQSFSLCGAKKGDAVPLRTPTGLKAFSLPGMAMEREDNKYDDNSSSLDDHRFTAGLTWDILKSVEGILLGTNPPVLYHVQRSTPWGDIEWLTENSPVKVVPESFKEGPMWPKGWPQQRMCYIDSTSSPGTYSYRISAVDIFGRISQDTNWVSVDLKRPAPPPPSDVEAKLLDPSDPSLIGDEKAWVTDANNKGTKIGLKLRWKWTPPLRRQAPDVSSFRIYFQPGWLNVVQGKIEQDPIETPEGMLELKTNYISNITPAVPDNVFAGEKMLMNLTNYTIESSKKVGTPPATTDKFSFIIRKPIPRAGDYSSSDFGTFRITNEAEIGSSSPNDLELTTDYKIPIQANTESFVGQILTIKQKQYNILSCRKDGTGYAIFTIPKIYPRKDDFFSIPITQQKEPQEGGTFIDYRKASSWQKMLHTEPLNQLSREQYEIIIIPVPPLIADRNNKVAYAQIGISSVNSENEEGSVSSPASIIAVFREPPPPQRLEDSPNNYATIPNYYGKSSYALRWKKPVTNDIRFFVYRAMDESLFLTDKENRAATDTAGKLLRSRDPGNYNNFLSNLDQVYRAEIENKVIRPGSIDYDELSKGSLKNILLQALASLPGNEKAFAKLHEQAIHPADDRFANRNTEITLGGEPEPPVDSTLLLYLDDTIDGSASNIYFYRIRTINEIGALGDFGSLSSFPVYLPNATPPVAPKITRVQGGDRQITLKWTSNREPDVLEYRVYRAENERAAHDLRLMTLVHVDAVAPEDPMLRPPEVVWTDSPLQGLVNFFYRIVAIDTNRNISEPSELIVAKAFDETLPVPPVPNVSWEDASGIMRARITWSSTTDQTLLQRRTSPSGYWLDTTVWRPTGASITMLDQDTTANNSYDYRVCAQKTTGAIAKGTSVTLPALT